MEETVLSLVPGELSLTVYLSSRLLDGLLHQFQILAEDVTSLQEALTHPEVVKVKQAAGEQILRWFKLTGSLPVKDDQLFVAKTELGFYSVLRVNQRTMMAVPGEDYMTVAYDLDCLDDLASDEEVK